MSEYIRQLQYAPTHMPKKNSRVHYCRRSDQMMHPRRILSLFQYMYCNLQCDESVWCVFLHTWWRHQMKRFSALLAFCAGNSPVILRAKARDGSFDYFFDLRLNKRLSKQCWGCWFETPSCPLWHHCDDSFLITGRVCNIFRLKVLKRVIWQRAWSGQWKSDT